LLSFDLSGFHHTAEIMEIMEEIMDEEIMDRWREYFDKLFNGESEGPTLELDDS